MRQEMTDKKRCALCNVLCIILNIEVNLTKWQQLFIVYGIYQGGSMYSSAIFKFLRKYINILKMSSYFLT